jgi:DNA-binding NarL/FixJ family response regulator
MKERVAMIRVLVADDHALVRRGVRMVLEGTARIEVVAEAGTGAEALDKARKVNIDVVVLDISMPGPGGLEVLRQMKDEHPHLPVLILTMHPEDQYAVRAFRAGASGYLTKQSIPEELINAVETVAAGRKYITPAVAEALACEVHHDTTKLPHEQLSDREYQVLLRIAAGKTVGEIAEELRLSPKTVSTYRTRILEKTEFRTNAELTRYAFAHKLVE